MNTVRYSITGSGIVNLVGDVQQIVGEHYVFVQDPVVVLVAEEYFIRTNSTLQSTLIFAFQDEMTCHLHIVTGGGSVGLLNLDWGTEAVSNLELFHAVRQVCASRGWTLRKESDT